MRSSLTILVHLNGLIKTSVACAWNKVMAVNVTNVVKLNNGKSRHKIPTLVKYGSWNSMISAHLNGQIFADLGICPYCFMVEESICVECRN